ncbi:MAG: hypothetical protein AB7O47_02070 [Flavobacteriales bacterium]
METKKTIIVSIITTLATMFIVAVIMHMCCGNCGGRSSCSKSKSHCEQSSSCKSTSSCSGKSKCGKEKKCSKTSCDKDMKTMEWTSEDDGKVVKKVIEVEIDEKK